MVDKYARECASLLGLAWTVISVSNALSEAPSKRSGKKRLAAPSFCWSLGLHIKDLTRQIA